MFKTLLKSVREYKIYAILSPIFVMLEVVFEVLIPYILKLMLDNGIRQGNNRYVLISGSIMFVCAALALVLGILSGKVATKASAGFAKNLRHDMYEKIQTYSFKNIDDFSTSSLVARMTNDVNQVELSFQMCIRIVVRAPFMLILAFSMALFVNSNLAMIFLVIIPFLGVTLIWVMSKSFKPFSRLFYQIDILNRDVEENLNAIRVVKSFVTEESETAKFCDDSTRLSNYAMKAEKYLAWNMPIVQFAVYASMIALAYLAARYIIVDGIMTTGDLSAYFTYLMQVLMSLMMISQIFIIIAMSKTAAVRITEVLTCVPDITNKDNPVFTVKDGSICFDNVDFKYADSSTINNLSNVSLDIKEGTTVGIIGGTGSGKSTFVQLIPRLYDVTSGKITVGGVDVRDYDLETLRNSVSYVLQKNVLFSGTIRENLLWGNENATDEDLILALKQASAYDFVMSFPKGLDHDLGQGGVNVSGGQKQRLCIARALLKRPKVLILDDSTSAVDTKTDALIRRELKTTMPNATKFIIAQRISSVEDADMILVFDDGKIIGQGTHSELLKTCPIYSEINDLQKKGSDSDEF